MRRKKGVSLGTKQAKLPDQHRNPQLTTAIGRVLQRGALPVRLIKRTRLDSMN